MEGNIEAVFVRLLFLTKGDIHLPLYSFKYRYTHLLLFKMNGSDGD